MYKKFFTINTIKIVHTFIWVVMAVAVFYILYCGIFGIFNIYLYVSLGLIGLETVVLLTYGWACPLTILAKKTKSDWKNGDDIFLPMWVAIHNKTIFGTLLAIGVALLLLRVLGKH